MLYKSKLHSISVGNFCDSIVNLQRVHFFLQNNPFLNELASYIYLVQSGVFYSVLFTNLPLGDGLSS